MVPSVVSQAFRVAVAARLSEDSAELLRESVGGGPEQRELQRALMLADRAAREWAASAIATKRPGAPNRLEELDQLGKPEDGYHALQPAARMERDSATSHEERQVATGAEELANAMADIDTEATNAGNRAAFVAVGEAAGVVLAEAGAVLGGEEFVIAQANDTLKDLVALDGWTNRLGPRFELS